MQPGGPQCVRNGGWQVLKRQASGFQKLNASAPRSSGQLHMYLAHKTINAMERQQQSPDKNSSNLFVPDLPRGCFAQAISNYPIGTLSMSPEMQRTGSSYVRAISSAATKQPATSVPGARKALGWQKIRQTGVVKGVLLAWRQAPHPGRLGRPKVGGASGRRIR